MSQTPDAALLATLARAIHPTRPEPLVLLEGDFAPAVWVERLGAQRLAGLVARALSEAGLLERLGEEERRALQRAVLSDQRERAALDEVARRAGRALADAGIPGLMLKGAVLGVLHYPEPQLRPMSDVDVLVPPDAVDGALAALTEAGFTPPSSEDLAFWEVAYYNVPLVAPGAHNMGVELHWSIAQADRHRVDAEGLIARRGRFVSAGQELDCLGPVDLMLHQALHHAYHLFQPRLGWLYDLVLLHRDPPPVDETWARARAWGMETAFALSCRYVEQVFPGSLGQAMRERALDHPRAAALLRRYGSDEPALLFDGWERRRRQLVLAYRMLDGGGQRVRALAGWAKRALRFGDRHGHERGAPLGRENESRA